MKDIKLNEFWMKLYEQVDTAVEDFAVLFDFWKSGDETEEEVKKAYDAAVIAVEDCASVLLLNATITDVYDQDGIDRLRGQVVFYFVRGILTRRRKQRASIFNRYVSLCAFTPDARLHRLHELYRAATYAARCESGRAGS